MPSVEHKWFSMVSESVMNTKVDTIVAEQKAVPDLSKKRQPKMQSSRKQKGCGYSCKLHDIRRSGLGKPNHASHMVPVSHE